MFSFASIGGGLIARKPSCPIGMTPRVSGALPKGGFRVDWYPSEVNTLTVQGDVYGGKEQAPVTDTTVDGQNLLGRWTRVFSAESQLQVQMYFDRTWRQIPSSTFAEDLKTYDLD